MKGLVGSIRTKMWVDVHAPIMRSNDMDISITTTLAFNLINKLIFSICDKCYHFGFPQFIYMTSWYTQKLKRNMISTFVKFYNDGEIHVVWQTRELMFRSESSFPRGCLYGSTIHSSGSEFSKTALIDVSLEFEIFIISVSRIISNSCCLSHNLHNTTNHLHGL